MSPPAQRSPGRPRIPAEHQRRRLLDAAERTFDAHRYEGASVQKIVREAGMSSRSFYEFFASKEELVTELARARAETFLGQMRDALRSTDDFAAAIDNVLRVFLESLPVVLLDLESLGGSAGASVRSVRSQYRDAIGKLLVEELGQLARKGLITAMPSPLALDLLLAGIEGLVIRYHGEGRREALVALHPQLLATIYELFPDTFGAADGSGAEDANGS